ncbi:putative periplasmic solute-binding protein (plasmid) [Legionella adelaidensis]|uniref:Endolytic murein transglycosylase n=2 Tax=Legionella adelaidensis TaxID=45056 RepID=A0A0W0R510_9GAMM|nr:endolytic transglycosylase MltG [Legionella adelaidensis]KTC66160.1 periplasmic solute-binding protein [Legionella adelaidensis]VEH85672.1 putative periplasmic solute-binding protein [Legionella adelaidensis]
MRRWIKALLISLIIFILTTLTILGLKISQAINNPMIAQGGKPVILEIDKNSTALAFVYSLYRKDLISSPRIMLQLIRYKNYTSKLKAGIYQINPGESPNEFLDRVVAGDVLKQPFRIIEGTTYAQVDENLIKAPFLKYTHDNWIANESPSSNPEGLLLADTYIYEAGSSSKTMLQDAHKKLLQYLEQSWQNREPNLPYKSPYELLIAASIIEKETGEPAEKRLIASVIVNRLNKHMPLQVDPTVIYALGPNFSGKLSHGDMQIDSPYNTYRYRGLPPTPIAIVGKDAIDAAAHPASTQYLYFVAKGDGTHQFSTSYEDQKRAINHYLRNNNGTK